MYAFTGADIYGRFMAMRKRDVFEPMGFDAFGIHSENFAIKRGVNPRQLTAQNVERFRETQLKCSGCRFDWSHEVNGSEPSYYRWSQWIFVQLCNAGLAVRRKAPVNWCPTDRTVLADEQVIDGRCERCDSRVEQRELEQWFLRITAFADRLLANLVAQITSPKHQAEVQVYCAQTRMRSDLERQQAARAQSWLCRHMMRVTGSSLLSSVCRSVG